MLLSSFPQSSCCYWCSVCVCVLQNDVKFFDPVNSLLTCSIPSASECSASRESSFCLLSFWIGMVQMYHMRRARQMGGGLQWLETFSCQCAVCKIQFSEGVCLTVGLLFIQQTPPNHRMQRRLSTWESWPPSNRGQTFFCCYPLQHYITVSTWQYSVST